MAATLSQAIAAARGLARQSARYWPHIPSTHRIVLNSWGEYVIYGPQDTIYNREANVVAEVEAE